MEIWGKDYTIAIVILMMGRELDDTRLTMASLLRSIRGLTGISISVLLNGSTDKEIEQHFEKIPNLTFYASPTNLGVAGGRNFLFTRPEVIGADIIMTLDNDLFLPTDYVRRMAEFLVSRPDAGLVGPVMLWTHFFDDLMPSRSGIIIDDITRMPVPVFSSEELKQGWIKRGNSDALYYLGTHNWVLTNCLAFPTSVQNLFIWLKNKNLIPWAPHLLLQSDPEVVQSLRGGTRELQTQTINGGGSVFFSSLLDTVGLLEPAYSPYGHEDHELAVRALRKGYRNYVEPNTFVLHGSETRQPARNHAWRKYQYARRRAITTRKTIGRRLARP
jgi:GT2 family glycosyltransferase